MDRTGRQALRIANRFDGREIIDSDLAKVVGKRCTIAGFPIRWEKGDGSIVGLVALVEVN